MKRIKSFKLFEYKDFNFTRRQQKININHKYNIVVNVDDEVIDLDNHETIGKLNDFTTKILAIKPNGESKYFDEIRYIDTYEAAIKYLKGL